MNIEQLEKEILKLSPKERESLALTAWESLAKDTTFIRDRDFDQGGVDLAKKRDEEIDAGNVEVINHETFKNKTSGNSQ